MNYLIVALLLPIFCFGQQHDTINLYNYNQDSLTQDSFIPNPEIPPEPLGEIFKFNYDLSSCQISDMNQKHFLKLYIDSSGNVWNAVVLKPCSCEEFNSQFKAYYSGLKWKPGEQFSKPVNSIFILPLQICFN